MPILVEPDTTTAGVLVPALPAGSQVLSRLEDVDGWLNRRTDHAVVIGPLHSPRGSVRCTPRPRWC
jgi:hypothetical protein